MERWKVSRDQRRNIKTSNYCVFWFFLPTSLLLKHSKNHIHVSHSESQANRRESTILWNTKFESNKEETQTRPQSRAAAAAASLILSCRLSSSHEPRSPASYCTTPHTHTHTHTHTNTIRCCCCVCEAENRSELLLCALTLKPAHLW